MVKVSLHSSVKHKGFTLIELMLATSLLMMVMFSGYYAYSLYSQKWQKRVQVFWHDTEQVIGLHSLNKLLTSAAPYIVSCENNQACIYFQGGKDQLSFVSNAAVFSKGQALVRLSLSDEDVDGNHQLIYQEQSLEHNLIISADYQPQWLHQIILIPRIRDVHFSYFGWPTYEQALIKLNSEVTNDVDSRAWYQEHLTAERRLLPEIVKVNFVSDKGVTDFQSALSQNSIYRLLAYTRDGM